MDRIPAGARDQKDRNWMGIDNFTMDIPMKSSEQLPCGPDAKVRRDQKLALAV